MSASPLTPVPPPAPAASLRPERPLMLFQAINKSLSALADVFTALARRQPVPGRRGALSQGRNATHACDGDARLCHASALA